MTKYKTIYFSVLGNALRMSAGNVANSYGIKLDELLSMNEGDCITFYPRGVAVVVERLKEV